MTDFTQYSNAYRYTRFERRDGILQIQIHRDGGSAVWDASPGGIHAELGDVFYQVGRDRENQLVILTGTGDDANTNAASIMIAEKGADLIRGAATGGLLGNVN